MSGGIKQLFQYATDRISQKDIVNFAPNDPGYPDYVRVYGSLYESRRLPSKEEFFQHSFEFIETISLTQWHLAEEEKDSKRFRRFRVFTNAVSLWLTINEWPDMPLNYVVVNLIDDATSLGDKNLYRLLVAAFGEIQGCHLKGPDEQPFVTLGILILSREGICDRKGIVEMIERFREEEKTGHSNYLSESDKFLWGLTNFDQLNHRWRRLIESHFSKLRKGDPLRTLGNEILAAT